MPDAVIRADAIQPAPAGYKVPGAQEILVKSVRAVVDGTGAGSAFDAVLQLIDPAGNVVWQAPTGVSIAAGGSADVSWFPGLTPTAAAASTGGISWATLGFTGANVVVPAAANRQFPTLNDFYTNAPSVFSRALNTDAGINGILVGQHGHYLLTGQFAVPIFGAGAVDLLFQLFEGPGPISQVSPFNLAEILSSTAVYGDGNASAAVTVNMVVQFTTAGGATVPIVWNVHNTGANAATTIGYGYMITQLDAVDQLI